MPILKLFLISILVLGLLANTSYAKNTDKLYEEALSSFNNKEYLDKLKLNSESNVLLFGCEGLTDDAMYQKLLNDGLQKI